MIISINLIHQYNRKIGISKIGKTKDNKAKLSKDAKGCVMIFHNFNIDQSLNFKLTSRKANDGQIMNLNRM